MYQTVRNKGKSTSFPWYFFQNLDEDNSRYNAVGYCAMKLSKEKPTLTAICSFQHIFLCYIFSLKNFV